MWPPNCRRRFARAVLCQCAMRNCAPCIERRVFKRFCGQKLSKSGPPAYLCGGRVLFISVRRPDERYVKCVYDKAASNYIDYMYRIRAANEPGGAYSSWRAFLLLCPTVTQRAFALRVLTTVSNNNNSAATANRSC